MDLDLSRRAEIHAALGDPHRLAMVDALFLTDRSPTELGDMLALGSNLISHHLDVLENLEIVRRVASEGDRRKRYVQLVPKTISGLDYGSRVQARRVVFVCIENSARSQLAEVLWNDIHTIRATSAGITPAAQVHRGAIRAAARRGHDLSKSHTKQVPNLSKDDLVISVCDRARDVLADHEAIRQLHWSVPDPVTSGSAKAFDHALGVLADRISAVAPRIVGTER